MTELGKRLEKVFDQLHMDKMEREQVFMMLMEQVGREMADIQEALLSEEDWELLDSMESQEEQEDFLGRRIQEEIGKDPQEISNEIMEEAIGNLIKAKEDVG